MRHLARYLVLASCLALTGSVADAGPGRRAGRHHKVKKAKAAKTAKHRVKVAPPVEQDTASDEDRFEDEETDAEAPATVRSSGNRAGRKHAETENDRVAFESDADTEMIEMEGVRDAPVELHAVATPAKKPKDWHVAIGPNLWVASVDATVSIGSASVASGVDFLDLERHARYGGEVAAEARFGRFSISADALYGVVDVDGGTDLGPLMVTVQGTASSLLVDGAAGYALAGDEHAVLSLEPRVGVRYQRTSVTGSVGVSGNTLLSLAQVDTAADALAGARVFLRPFNRLSMSGNFDLGVFGTSASTWSASADASLRITSRVLLSLGWRTLTMERANLSMVMHGPRGAVQVLF